MRDDLGKLFLGKDAVAYITRNTPGPGAYELGWQRPVFLFPSREPGTSIGGPLANVDRVQTGPLGAAYRSDTPGPGAYDDTGGRGIRIVPTRRSADCKGYYSAGGSTNTSRTDPGRVSTKGTVSLSFPALTVLWSRTLQKCPGVFTQTLLYTCFVYMFEGIAHTPHYCWSWSMMAIQVHMKFLDLAEPCFTLSTPASL